MFAGFRCTLTHTGHCVFSRRMFPHLKVNLSGLIPCAKYILLVDMVPEDGFRYKVRQMFFFLHSRQPITNCKVRGHSGSCSRVRAEVSLSKKYDPRECITCNSLWIKASVKTT